MMKLTVKQTTLRAALAAALAAVTLGSQAVEGTATATGTVIAPIAINKVTDLNFGRFAPGTGGTITVSTSGEVTTSGVINSSLGSPAAAKFDVTGDANATYTITYAGTSPSLSDGATTPNTMAMSIHSDLTGGNTASGTPVDTGTLSASGTQSIYVGGTLTVDAAQPAGTYNGDVKVQVEYN